MDHKEASKRSSKRPSSSRPDAGRDRKPERPPAKKQALPQQPSSSEDIRSAVKGLYEAYQRLVDAEGPSGAAFQALLKATSAGDLASRRLAARLVPRFLLHHPEHSEPAAAALIRLHSQQQACEPSCKHLEDQTRHDALQGLSAVLRAARACRAPNGEAAVKLVLDYLFRLLPQAASEEPSEPEEEGEVAPTDGSTASLPYLRRTLGEALTQHPAATMAYCSACLAAAAACRSNNSSSSRDCPDPQVTSGVQIWLRDHLLKERSPSRECTPTAAAAAAAAAKAGDALAAGSGGAAGGGRNGCLLQSVLLGSEELQGWVMRQARGRATAPPEVRSVIETALQLLPEDKQLAAIRPRINHAPAAAAAAAAAAANSSHGMQQAQQQHQQSQQQLQQQRLKSAGSLPHYRQHQNGGLINGAEPLSRSNSTPGQLERDRSRAAGSKPGPPDLRGQQQQQQQFPQLPGPICRAEACLLVLDLPPHISRQEVQQILSADEAWLAPQQQQQQPGSSRPAGNNACCTFKGVLEAAKAYLRHNGMQRISHCPPLRLAFCGSLPPCSAKAAAAAAQPSGYVWATRDAVGDAESITDELRAAGLLLNHVHRVNNAAEPGTLLQTPSGAHAASVVSYLLKKHPQQQQQRLAEQQGEQDMPPLPPEPPPAAAEWARQQQQQQQAIPPLPPGPPPINFQQQQQQQPYDRGGVGGAGRPASPGLQQQQQQQRGYADPGGTANFRRSYSSPSVSAAGAAAAGGAGGWKDSPSEWNTTPSHPASRWGPGSQQQQPGIPPPMPPPLPPGQQPPGAISGGGWHSVHQPQQQQQQQRWGQGGPPPGLTPPSVPYPNSIPTVQQNQLQQGASPHAHVLPPGTAAALARGGSAGSSPASQGGSYHQQQQQQQQPARVLWQGSIVKQSVHMCGVACLPGGPPPDSGSSMAGSAPEPRCWPEALHVNFRICVTDALEQYAHSAPEQRAIRVLLPLNPGGGDAAQLQTFINYLNGKDRAGMVKLPALREQGLGPRAVYLITPRAAVCQQLQVGWDGRCAMLIAVVVPQLSAAGAPGGSGGGSAHRGYR